MRWTYHESSADMWWESSTGSPRLTTFSLKICEHVLVDGARNTRAENYQRSFESARKYHILDAFYRPLEVWLGYMLQPKSNRTSASRGGLLQKECQDDYLETVPQSRRNMMQAFLINCEVAWKTNPILPRWCNIEKLPSWLPALGWSNNRESELL